MPEIRAQQEAAHAARAAVQQADDALHAGRSRLTNKRNQLAQALRQGDAGRRTAAALQRDIRALETQVEADRRALSAARAELTRRLGEFPGLDRPWDLIAELDDNLPFLLLPVRIETRFMTVGDGKQLWVRIFPDDVAVSTHEKTLTADEVADGEVYWRQRWQATRATEASARQAMEQGAWRTLAAAHGETRGAWIVRETKPATLDVASADALAFPQRDPDALADASWSRAPRSHVMPDRFVVMGYAGGSEVVRALGNPIPTPLIVGPDPQQLENEYRQQDGELLVGDDIAWIYDFDRAVEVGMGMRIALQEPHASQGFDRLIVLGLRLASDERENQTLLDELFESHHYAPEGMSLLPQGTPTNNTEGAGSGFSSEDARGETSFAEATDEVLFEPTAAPLDKTDGQRLVEALGTSQDSWQRIRGAEQRDVREAMLMNRALWYGTLGYYLEQLLELDSTSAGFLREFFTNFVTGRGALPAIRVGSQPYGFLLTSDFAHWQWSAQLDGDRLPFLDQLYQAARRGDAYWQAALPAVARVGGPGDPYQTLLNILGLHPSSVEYYRRYAVGQEYLWNYLTFLGGTARSSQLMTSFEPQAQSLAQELGWNPADPPRLFSLAFFRQQEQITGPLVDDIAAEETETLSETRRLRSAYAVPDPANPDARLESNYIAWLARALFDDVKTQRLANLAGEALPPPSPLLYRMLYGALLQAYYDATAQLYGSFQLLSPADRREAELGNVRSDRSVTRWELMDTDVSRVMPQLSQDHVSVGGYLQSDAGQSRPEALGLNEVRAALDALIDLPTARLERIFVEHLDLCSYRLDAWQTGFFARRLQQQRYPPSSGGAFENRVQGIHLGAFGWLEDVRPAAPLTPADTASLPASLHDLQRDGALFEQPENAGFIHAPSLHHAVVAAVLRNAYVTHFDPDVPEKMAVNLSSARVRTALDFLDGIRNGQELGALLGYQFERGLHDRYGDPSLNQFLPALRQKYPLVADKITADADGAPIDTKEARNVLDGYALAEAAVLKEPPLAYPYGVEGLPADPTSSQARAIQAELSRLGDSLDAIADLALAEGVYQAVQGNFDRAAGMLKAVTEGNNPPEPEIVRTPRSGTALIQRVVLHLPGTGGSPSPWPGPPSPRANAEPAVNRWLGDIVPPPHRIKFRVRLGDADPVEQDLTVVALQPIDLVYLIADELAAETTELERRIAHENRRHASDDALLVRIDAVTGFADPSDVPLFALLPLLKALRAIVTGSRALGADDFQLPSEATSDPAADPNPRRYDLDELRARTAAASAVFGNAIDALALAIPPADAAGHRDLAAADAERLRAALRSLADFGVLDAFPRSAFGDSDAARAVLVEQAAALHAIVQRQRAAAAALLTAGDAPTLAAAERASRYGEAAKQLLGSAFNLIPVFNLQNPAELHAAAAFRDAEPTHSLTRHHQDNPLIMDEWLQGAARVRDRLGELESIFILGATIGGAEAALKPLQLPFRAQDHWVGMGYPEDFVPEGEFLSIVQWLPAGGFDSSQPQRGLLIDEWVEVIPGTRETTGIAVHYDQPSTEPPQVLLLAVTPVVTGAWAWDRLVGILHDTLDRAKLRAVEPDQLGRTALGQMLPALVSAVATPPLATISTDFVGMTAVSE